LNVLLNQNLRAVRIDESRMIVHALTERGEAQVQLNPTGRDEPYLRRVRELFSTHALGSPGGYPVYLKRWTRMGQMRDESLNSLLVLGEPEAVVAVAHAPGLSEDLARCAWWAMPTAEIARKMLANDTVSNSTLGKELAAYLVEYLPFETEPHDIVDSVRLVLQPGLIDEATRDSLWKKALRKSAYYVGFLVATPDELPDAHAAHPAWLDNLEPLTQLAESGNSAAQQLKRLLSGEGQSYLATVAKAMDKVANQEVMVALLKAIALYFRPLWAGAGQTGYFQTSEAIEADTQQLLQSGRREDVQQVLQALPELEPQLTAMLHLAMVGEPLVDPIFSQTDAVGSLMRKKLHPVTQWLQDHISQLQG
jgi:hypothetical protein